MLQVGREKVDARGLSGRIEFVTGDAQRLPFEDDSFDGVTIAFGIRNVADRARALREMARVTRSGGRVVILELSEPRKGLLAPLARWHVHTVVPWLGALLSGRREYRYLEQSISAFPTPDEFCTTLEQSGLSSVSVERLSFGVSHLFVSEPSPP